MYGHGLIGNISVHLRLSAVPLSVAVPRVLCGYNVVGGLLPEGEGRDGMDIATIRAFFLWCTILNVALLFVAFIPLVCARDWVYRMQSKWLPISREAFDVAIYSFLGLFKIVIICFNLVPYLALLIVG
jgi:hypothetical protein